MTYVSVVTLVAYALVLVALAVVAAIDVRERRVPNWMTGALAGLWVLWRLVLGFAGEHMGLGFQTELLSPAPDVLVPPGLSIAGISFADGILGSIILGGGLLVLTTVYELAMHRESFGGGDIKLMAVLGLFLGLERGVICLLAACVLSVAFMIGRTAARKLGFGGKARRVGPAVDLDDLSEDDIVPDAVDTFIPDLPDRDSLLAGTMPFAPFIALGTLVAFVA